MQHLGLILLVFAFVFATIAACIVQGTGRWHFGWGALAFYLLAVIVGGVGRVLG
jgi:hypothetical protein